MQVCGRRQARARAVGDIGVAIAAIDTETADMMLVAEGDGLRGRVDIGARIEIGARKSDTPAKSRRRSSASTADRRRRSQVSALGENICGTAPTHRGSRPLENGTRGIRFQRWNKIRTAALRHHGRAVIRQDGHD